MTFTERRAKAEAARARALGLKGQRVEIAVAPCLFPTPAAIARRVVELAEIEPGMTVLEPSAGTGALLDELPEGCNVTAIEIVPSLSGLLRRNYPEAIVHCEDFLGYEPGRVFDRIIANPPFDHGSDIKHILHARGLLASGGRLVAICADGSRQLDGLRRIAKWYEPLPAGSFAAQGTNVRTAIVVIESSAS